jgi:hypothetical protein
MTDEPAPEAASTTTTPASTSSTSIAPPHGGPPRHRHRPRRGQPLRDEPLPARHRLDHRR